MKKINACLFVTLIVVVVLFVCLILVRDTINRHQYAHFEQVTLEKTQELMQANLTAVRQVEHLSEEVASMAVRLDSLQTRYGTDSVKWAQRELLSHRRLEQTKKQLNESVRNQTFQRDGPPRGRPAIPALRRSRLDSLP